MATKVNLPQNDSLRVRLRVRLADGSFLPLTGYTITLAVTGPDGSSAYRGSGAAMSPDTSAMSIVPPNILSTPGLYQAAMRAENLGAQDAHTGVFTIQVTAHA